MEVDNFIQRFSDKFDYDKTSLSDLEAWLIKNFNNHQLESLYEIVRDNWDSQYGVKFPSIKELQKLWNKYKASYTSNNDNWVDRTYKENDFLSVKMIINKIKEIRDKKTERGYFLTKELEFIACYDPLPFCWEVLKKRGMDETNIEKYLRVLIDNNLKTGKEINFNKLKGIKTPYSPENFERDGKINHVSKTIKNFNDI